MYAQHVIRVASLLRCTHLIPSLLAGMDVQSAQKGMASLTCSPFVAVTVPARADVISRMLNLNVSSGIV